MKKLNKKGVTLIELIVSFALVSVAVGYFYQTLFTVKKLYSKSQKETQEFVDKTYALRIVDAYVDAYIDKRGCISRYEVCRKYDICSSILTASSDTGRSLYCDEKDKDKDPSLHVVDNRDKIFKITIQMKNGKKVVLYKYIEKFRR